MDRCCRNPVSDESSKSNGVQRDEKSARLKFSVCSEISVVGEAVSENEDGLRRTLSGEG